ncbi:serine carboxypeptidase [Bombardia bombarda]|uniref:Serine carboxypeptidase n=1 Tax=Bombardia bombarda TaxID=252184 RepID=A0AA39WU67_9PEZI|nr:serine carboxypeptidase [Bombardia bombarda]
MYPELAARHLESRGDFTARASPFEKRQAQPLFLNDKTRPFAINGSAIPEVDFDVGESYAGLLPINGTNTSNELFFWFFPSTNPVAQEGPKEVMIWLTGGPGCSSVGELLQSNGPMLWQPGTFKPFANKWSWHHLSNVVWIDSPIGAGFSHGTVTAEDERDVARQFLGFWKNFVDTFSLQGAKVYVTGSSYSGMYTPYISSAMLDENDKDYFNVSGMLIFDGLFSKRSLPTDIPVAAFVNQWKDVFAFNDSYSQSIQSAADQCGYTEYLQKYLVFPPAGIQPSDLPGQQDDDNELTGCDLFVQVYLAALELNPCFNVYEVADRCPLVYDPLGFSVGTNYVPDGAGPAYFNRADVKAAIHAPVNQTWEFCATQPVFVNGTDKSVNEGPGSQPVIPHVIDRTQNVIIGHSSQGFVLMADGTLLSIQNMTWGGKLGFQEQPVDPLYIPRHVDREFTEIAGAGVFGTSHSERGLTYIGVAPAGHFLTADQPAVAFRALEILLGRVENFQSTAPFTTDASPLSQPSVEMGNGTVLVGLGDGDITAACNSTAAESGTTQGGAQVAMSSARTSSASPIWSKASLANALWGLFVVSVVAFMW